MSFPPNRPARRFTRPARRFAQAREIPRARKLKLNPRSKRATRISPPFGASPILCRRVERARAGARSGTVRAMLRWLVSASIRPLVSGEGLGGDVQNFLHRGMARA
jgi:hypothetical protein